MKTKDLEYGAWDLPIREFISQDAPVRQIICTRLDAASGENVRIEYETDTERHVLVQRFIYHSPTGFEFGYAGSGPSDLALNVLALFVHPKEAFRLRHEFKLAYIASMEMEGGRIAGDSIKRWIQSIWEEEESDIELMSEEAYRLRIKEELEGQVE